MPHPMESLVHTESAIEHRDLIPQPKSWVARIVRRINSALLDE